MRAALVTALVAVLALGTAALTAPQSAVPGTPAPAMARCELEDGSGDGQAFPCYWDGGSNGQGLTYVLTAPAGLEIV